MTKPPQNTRPPMHAVSRTPGRGLAIAALVVGVAAFFSGLLPYWGILAGGLAIILGAIALANHQSKGAALTGLILGVVAVIASLVTTMPLLGATRSTQPPASSSPIESSAQSSPTATAGSGQPSPPPTPSQSPQASPTSAPGDNLVPLNSPINSDKWSVVVTSFTADGNAAVAAAGASNPAPPPGAHYAIVKYKVTYSGTESDYAVAVAVALVTPSGDVIDADGSLTGFQEGLSSNAVYHGDTVTSAAAFVVPDATTVVVRVQPGYFTDKVLVATH